MLCSVKLGAISIAVLMLSGESQDAVVTLLPGVGENEQVLDARNTFQIQIVLKRWKGFPAPVQVAGQVPDVKVLTALSPCLAPVVRAADPLFDGPGEPLQCLVLCPGDRGDLDHPKRSE